MNNPMTKEELQEFFKEARIIERYGYSGDECQYVFRYRDKFYVIMYEIFHGEEEPSFNYENKCWVNEVEVEKTGALKEQVVFKLGDRVVGDYCFDFNKENLIKDLEDIVEFSKKNSGFGYSCGQKIQEVIDKYKRT